MSDEGKCKRPDQLKGRPEQCTPEQIKACRGDADDHPCVPPAGCQKPERLRGSAEQCSPAQIRECHGDDKSHPCE